MISASQAHRRAAPGDSGLPSGRVAVPQAVGQGAQRDGDDDLPGGAVPSRAPGASAR